MQPCPLLLPCHAIMPTAAAPLLQEVPIRGCLHEPSVPLQCPQAVADAIQACLKVRFALPAGHVWWCVFVLLGGREGRLGRWHLRAGRREGLQALPWPLVCGGGGGGHGTLMRAHTLQCTNSSKKSSNSVLATERAQAPQHRG